MVVCPMDPDWDVEQFYLNMWDNGFIGPDISDDMCPSPEDLQQLCYAVKEVFCKGDAFPNINPPCVIISDLNGDHKALITTTTLLGKGEATRYCFLGNYIGKGGYMSSLRNICTVLVLKAAYPRAYQLLRGDRETREGAMKNGFYDELLQVYGDEGEELFETFIDVFNWMPLAGTVGKRILCVHGGISPELHTEDDIRKIPRPLPNPWSNYLATDLLLAEPGDFGEYYRTNPNNNSLCFGKKELSKTLQRMGMLCLVRGSMEQFRLWGQGHMANRKVICLNTNLKYGRAASMKIAEGGKYGFGMIHNLDDSIFVDNGMVMGA